MGTVCFLVTSHQSLVTLIKQEALPDMLKNKMKRLALAVGLALSCVMPAAAQEFMPVSEVKEGMHGYTKTVVQGTKIDTFLSLIHI